MTSPFVWPGPTLAVVHAQIVRRAADYPMSEQQLAGGEIVGGVINSRIFRAAQAMGTESTWVHVNQYAPLLHQVA